MKKKIYGLGAIFAIAILTVLNISLTELGDDSESIALLDLKVAAASDTEWNHWTDWLTQGFKKDEREEPVACSNSGGGTIRVCIAYRSGGCIEWEYRNSGPVSMVRCLYGNSNCSSSSC